eukprot:GEMP01048043.1.p1 GENE.GEMP01048043.1~~GEMP01048043.1.p1  ORF type:complete len:141 (+),score=35.21 GEMP01048043.1:203-625(+)
MWWLIFATVQYDAANLRIVGRHNAWRIRDPCFDSAVTADDKIGCAKKTLQDILGRLQRAEIRDMTKKQYCAEHAPELKDELEEATTQKQDKEIHLAKVLHDCPQCTGTDEMNAEDDLRYWKQRIGNMEDQIEALRDWCMV